MTKRSAKILQFSTFCKSAYVENSSVSPHSNVYSDEYDAYFGGFLRMSSVQRAVAPHTSESDSDVSEPNSVIHMGSGRFVTDRTLRVISYDRAAEQFLGSAPYWVIAGGRLTRLADAGVILDPVDLIGSKSARVIGPIVGQADTGMNGYWLASLTELDGDTLEIVVTKDRAFDTSRLADLGPIFGVTRSEMIIARLIVEGMNVDMMAKEMGLAINTVRTHVKRLHAKTGVHDTASLVALCLRFSV
jgi:DNA-binding CsgD family transcriptional regulator